MFKQVRGKCLYLQTALLKEDKEVKLRLRLHYAIYRLRFYSKLLIRVKSQSKRFQSHTVIYREFKGIGQTNHIVQNTMRLIGYDSIKTR